MDERPGGRLPEDALAADNLALIRVLGEVLDLLKTIPPSNAGVLQAIDLVEKAIKHVLPPVYYAGQPSDLGEAREVYERAFRRLTEIINRALEDKPRDQIFCYALLVRLFAGDIDGAINLLPRTGGAEAK